MDDLLNNLPALEPPPGVVPDFSDGTTAAAPLAAGLAIMMFIATLGFAARMFTKAYVMKQVQLEDYVLIIGWALFIVYNSVGMVGLPVVVGRHQWDVTIPQMEYFLQFLNNTEISYDFCMLFTKLAILLQIKRIFHGTTRDSVHWLSISLMVLDVTYYIASAISEIAQCVPREKIWNPLLPGTCINNNTKVVVDGAFNFTIDLLIFMLPIYAILRLKMVIKRKLGICAIFATGLLACISSFLRMYYSIYFLTGTDVTFNVANLFWTACLEGASALLVASFPVMPRLYQYIRNKTSTGSTKRPSYRATFGFGSSNRRLRPGFQKPDISTSTTNYSDEEEKQLRREWAPPLGEAGGHSFSSAQAVDVETGLQSHRPQSPDGRNIMKTIRVDAAFEPAHLRS